MHQLSPDALFRALLRDRPDTPALTWYDEDPAHLARVELSARSLATWAAKTAGLLGDELGVGPGDAVALDLPPHWLTVGLLAGAWAAGAAVALGPAPAPVAFCAHDRAAAALAAGAGDVFVTDPTSPLQLGGPDDTPPGTRDLPSALRPHADRLPVARPVDADAPALAGAAGAESPAARPSAGPTTGPSAGGRTAGELAAAAPARAAALGLGPGARVLWAGPLATVDDVVTAVLAPWAVGGSLVLVTGPLDAARRDALAGAEAAVPLG